MPDKSDNWGYSEEGLKHYTAHRAVGPITIDGRPDEETWALAPRSPRFEDLVDGRPGLFDTRVSIVWDDDCLYVAFWVEEPHLEATYTQRDSMICAENDVEIFIAGEDAYYEFELNALGTIMERMYIWQDAYRDSVYARSPEFDLLNGQRICTLGGPGSGFRHPRGRRWAFLDWDFPGLKWAVHLDGTINDDRDVDKGWTAEIAFPWKGLKWLAEGRSLPGKEGDIWRMDLSRFEHIRTGGGTLCPGWALNAHGFYDSHIPHRFSYIHLSETEAGKQ